MQMSKKPAERNIEMKHPNMINEKKVNREWIESFVRMTNNNKLVRMCVCVCVKLNRAMEPFTWWLKCA